MSSFFSSERFKTMVESVASVDEGLEIVGIPGAIDKSELSAERSEFYDHMADSLEKQLCLAKENLIPVSQAVAQLANHISSRPEPLLQSMDSDNPWKSRRRGCCP